MKVVPVSAPFGRSFSLISLLFLLLMMGCAPKLFDNLPTLGQEDPPAEDPSAGSGDTTGGAPPDNGGGVPPGPSEVNLKWDPVTNNADGSPITDLAGYNIYYGVDSRVYPDQKAAGVVTQTKLTNLPKAIVYITATAYDTTGNESAYSNEVTVDLRNGSIPKMIQVRFFSPPNDPNADALAKTERRLQSAVPALELESDESR